jgi:hypothetical protein
MFVTASCRKIMELLFTKGLKRELPGGLRFPCWEGHVFVTQVHLV